MRTNLYKGAKELGIELSPLQLDQFGAFYKLLLEWNEKINLTTITAEKDVLVKHFLDSLSGASVFSMQKKMKVADIGTGGGFPGIPLAIAFPEASFLLMDATGKKVRFLKKVIEELGLFHVDAVQGRAEEMAHQEGFREHFDLVVSRAVASMPVLLEYLAGFAKPGGQIAAYKGPSVSEEMTAAERAIRKLGLSTKEQREIRIGEYAHSIVLFEKKAALNAQYPRTQAQIKKNPL